MDRETAQGRRRRGAGRVTIKTVAARAGVAPITVSRALNQPDTVSPQLRARIRAVVEELGYVPNRMAGGLASARSRAIPVVVPSLANVVFLEVIRGAREVLEKSGYHVLLGETDYDLDREHALLETLLGWSPAGAVVAGLHHRDRTRVLLRSWGRPLVEVMEYGPNRIDMNVGLSHEAAGAAMAAHLLERGYRRPGFIGTRLDADYRAAQRLAGYRRRLAEAGTALTCLLDYEQPSTVELGGHALHRVLAEHTDVDALFFANDDLAVGAILRAQREGIPIPQRIAVAGFNGLPLSSQVTPRLTTIVSPRHRMGRIAGEMLLQRLSGEQPARPAVDLGFTLQVREST